MSDDVSDELCDTGLSLQLHSRMLQCGFSSQRSRLWQHAAAVLEQVANAAAPAAGQQYRLCGSFGDAWGCHLLRMDGRVAADSDIDWTAVDAAKLHHFPSTCQCEQQGLLDTRGECEEGHVDVGITLGQPAHATSPIGVRPAVDHCEAVNCCSMGSDVQEQLVKETPQLVHACRPGELGDMRLSFTKMESEMVRSFTEVQGQLFVLLKFLIKRVLPQRKRVLGLKSYHAKTLMLQLVTELPASAFAPQLLVSLADISLQLLLEMLSQGSEHDNICMWSIFQREAPIFFKSDAPSKSQVRRAVRELREELRHHLRSYLQLLRPLQSPHAFLFHPFCWLPRCELRTADCATDFSDAYGFVLHSLQLLTRPPPQSPTHRSVRCLLPQLAAAPACMRTAAACLTAIAHLWLGDCHAALASLPQPCAAVLRSLHQLPHHHLLLTPAAHSDTLLHLLHQTDSAWRFCFFVNYQPQLSFLPPAVRNCCFNVNSDELCYVNFHALAMCLRLSIMQHQHQTPSEEMQRLVELWLEDVMDRRDWDVDFQELHCIAAFATHAAQLSFCLRHMLQAPEVSEHSLTATAAVRARLADADNMQLWHQQLQESAGRQRHDRRHRIDLIAFGCAADTRRHAEFACDQLQLLHPSRQLHEEMRVFSILQRLHPDPTSVLYRQLRVSPQPDFIQVFVLGLYTKDASHLSFALDTMRRLRRAFVQDRTLTDLIRYKVHSKFEHDWIQTAQWMKNTSAQGITGWMQERLNVTIEDFRRSKFIGWSQGWSDGPVNFQSRV